MRQYVLATLSGVLIGLTIVGIGSVIRNLSTPPEKTTQTQKNSTSSQSPTTSPKIIKPTESPVIDEIAPTIAIDCENIATKAKSLATTFLNNHKSKVTSKVLSQISPPSSQEDQDQLDFWEGTDSDSIPRLYQTTPTSYSIKSFSLGTLADRGYDSDERGDKRCQMTVYEVRTTTVDTNYTEDTVTRFLDFAVTITGDVTISAYRDEKEGKKYSGFN